MSFFASVAGHQVVSGSIMIPLVGAWTADVSLATDAVVAGPVAVVLGNLTLQGFVYRGDPSAGQTQVRIVGGSGGWRKTVQPQGYGSGSGVKLATILGDVARDCGERVAVSGSATVGTAWARLEGNASDVLWQLVALGAIPSWHVDPAGVTQVQAWPARTVGTPFTVIDQQSGSGLVTIATEDYAGWLPGCSFSAPTITGSPINGGVTFVFDNEGQARLEVMTTLAKEDRLLAALEALIARQVEPTRFYGRYRYTISSPTATTIDATPVDNKQGLPEFQKVPIDADSISSFVPPDGGECHIMFLDGIPTQPVCVWTGDKPTHASILDGTSPAAKLGDTVQSMISGQIQVFGGTLAVTGVTPGSANLVVGAGLLNVVGLNPISGSITTGSSQVGLPP
jgi:hypothetical protein